ncbi:MAG: serpin family protein [Pirellulaceae bacterium]|nr:serpin family protein [Pirellulaceae bacterium]
MRWFLICSFFLACVVGCDSESPPFLSTEIPFWNEPDLDVTICDFQPSPPSDADLEVASSVGDVVDVAPVVEGGNRFALDLYRQLREQEGNLFFSPASSSIALTMALAGASGKTAQAMRSTLHLQMPEVEIHRVMRQLQSAWSQAKQNQPVQLHIASRLWGDDRQNFLTPFLEVTRRQYDAPLARLDFRQSENAREEINDWTEQQTQGKIRDLIPSGAINTDTRLVLTNAIYFQGNWSTAFKKKRTLLRPFYVTPEDKVQVPMMQQIGRFHYGENDDLQILELPYGEGEVSMFVLLPRKRDGLKSVEEKLSTESVKKWIGRMQPRTDVRVFLPKFKLTAELNLVKALGALGMTSAFDERTADFSGTTGNRDLYISAVLHKAFVDVHEEGTEAAAATGIVLKTRSLAPGKPKESPVFRADHPFVFLIRDNMNDAILFLGRMEKPPT